MDHDNEVTKSLVEARRFFLNQRVDDDTRQERYNLEEEFEKTARKRPKVVPLVLLAVLAAAGGISFGTIALLDLLKPENPAVVDNFQELRLREILNTARRNEQALANQERDLDALVAERDTAIDQARADARAALALLGQRLIPAAERNRQRAQILQQERQSIARIQTDFSSRIAEKEAEVERVRGEVAAYQARLTDQDRREQALIASSEAVAERQTSSLQSSYEERLQRLESQSRETIQAERAFHQEYVKLSEERHAEEIRQLILLYNPVIQGDEAAAVLELQLPDPAAERAPYPDVLTREGLWTPAAYQELWAGMTRADVLHNRLAAVPYENSVPAVLEQWRRQTWATFTELEKMWASLALRIQQKNRIIEEKDLEIASREAEIVQRDGRIEALGNEIRAWQRTLTAVADESGGLGIIAAVENPQRLRVWPATGAALQNGQRAQAVSGGAVVGVVEFFLENGAVWARTVSTVQPARPVRLLDRVRLVPQVPAP